MVSLVVPVDRSMDSLHAFIHGKSVLDYFNLYNRPGKRFNVVVRHEFDNKLHTDYSTIPSMPHSKGGFRCGPFLALISGVGQDP